MPVYLKDVKRELRKFGRQAGKYPTYRVSKLTPFGSEITKSVSYKVVVHGETNNYQVNVQFFKVFYSGDKKPNYLPVNAEGEKVYYRVPTTRSNPVHLKCSCPDFRFRFEKELFDAGGLVGNWRRYTRKTPPPPAGYPYANPEHYLGFCKHIWSALDHLKSKGLVKE